MGGKTKHSQRTKNNARPSSSGRSALLIDNVKFSQGMVPGPGNELPALFPTLQAPIVDPTLSPEMQMCVKKLSKKDPITKTKGLQELCEVVGRSEPAQVEVLLPSWAHHYQLLTSDPDRRVREITQLCHGSIVSACGRRVAPHLKALVPAWLRALHDEHAPASSHASASLAKTFPDNKLPEVISFCKEEILSHLVENLTGNGDLPFVRKAESAEEQEAQRARVVASSLHGLRHAVRLVPAALAAWLWPRLQRLLRDKAFWRHAASAHDELRAAWYGAVGSVTERFPDQLAAECGEKTLGVMVSARETSPLAAAQLWDALLLFMANVQEWHTYLRNTELFSKRILETLESGGWGEARRLALVLLPLLAHLPPALRARDFYCAFFRAILQGLDRKSIQSSRSELAAWVASLEECARYVSTQPHAFVGEVLGGVVRGWLTRALGGRDAARAGTLRLTAAALAALARYWLRQAQRQPERYEPLLRNYWHSLAATLCAQVESAPAGPEEVASLIDAHILLLHTLKTSFAQEGKRQLSIKFADDAVAAAERPREVARCEPALLERYSRGLDELAHAVCGRYLERCGAAREAGPVLGPLSALLAEHDSARLWASVARQLGCDSPLQLYERELRAWLAGDTMRCEPLVDILFLLLPHLSEPEQDAVFQSFQQFLPAVVEWCVCASVRLARGEGGAARGGGGAARRWLRARVAHDTLCAASARLCATGDPAAARLLLLCLDHDAHGELVVGAECCERVLRALCGAVRAASTAPGALEACARLAAQLASTLPAALPAYPDLVLALVHLTARVPRGDERLSLDTWWSARAGWQDGLGALPAERRRDLLQRAAAILQEESLEAKQVSEAVSLCPYLLSSSPERDASEIVWFTRLLFARRPPAPPRAHALALRSAIVRGLLNCPHRDHALTPAITDDHDTHEPDELDKEELESWFANVCFRALYLKSILLHRADEEVDDSWCEELLRDAYLARELCAALHEYCLLRVLDQGFAFWPHYLSIKETKERLEALVTDIISECSVQTRSHILDMLTEAAATEGYFWPLASTWFELHAKQLDVKDANKNLENPFDCQGAVENSNVTEKDCHESEKKCSEVVEKGQNHIEDEVTKESQINVIDDQKHTHEKDSSETVQGVQRHKENADGSQEVTKEGVDGDGEKSQDDEIETFDMEMLQNIVTGNGYFHTLQARAAAGGGGGAALRAHYLVMVRSLHAAHAAEPAVLAALARDAARHLAACDADLIVNAYYCHNHVMLYEQDVSAAAWARVVSNAAVADYLAALVRARGWDLPAHHWDFTTITLCNLLASLLSSKDHWGSTKVALLARAVLDLFLAVEAFVCSVTKECESRTPSAHVAHLPHEWHDMFAPAVHSSLARLVLAVLEHAGRGMSSARAGVLRALARGARRLAWRHVRGAGRAGAAAARAAHVLAAPAALAYKFLAYETLLALLEPMVLDDAEALAAWGGQGARPELALRAAYGEPARALARLVPAALAHLRPCEETCSLAPGSDVLALALGWCLLADACSRHVQLARSDLRHHYTHIFREQTGVEALLTSALRLVPAEVLAAASPASPAAPAARHAHMFTRMPDLDAYTWCGAESVAAAACRALYWCVCGAGAGEARGWRGAAHHRHARLLDNLVAMYITPHVVKEELTELQQRASEIEDTEVAIFWSQYEVAATLTVEECPLELRVQLSRSHPLGLPQLALTGNAVVAGSTGWLVLFMAYERGSVRAAVRLWAAAVASRLGRAAKCFICYCLLHYATGKLPSAACRTCRNRFHPACVNKWFSTSGRRSCPLCRGIFT